MSAYVPMTDDEIITITGLLESECAESVCAEAREIEQAVLARIEQQGLVIVPVEKLETLKWRCDKIKHSSHHCDFRVQVEATSQQIKAMLEATKEFP